MQFSRFGDNLIHNILKILQLVERTYNYCKAKMEIVNGINIALHNAGMADRIVEPQQIQCFEYNIIR